MSKITPPTETNPFPTVRDVSAKAGVSYATASRVLTDSTDYRVSPKTRQKVLDAAQALGYSANLFARSLVTRQSHLIGLCIGGNRAQAAYPVSQAPIQARIDVRLSGLCSHPQFNKYDLTLLVRDEDDPLLASHLVAKARLLAGMIYVNPRRDSLEALRQVARICPLVVEDAMGLTGFHTVSIDQRQAIRLACECLQRRGCRSVGWSNFLGQDYFSAQARYQAFYECLGQLGLPANAGRVRVSAGAGDEDHNYRVTSQLLHDYPDLDGLIVGRDQALAGALHALADFRRVVGKDVKVVSINETTACLLSSPPISAVSFPSGEMARHSFDLLMQQLERPGLPPQEIILPPHLNERESTLGLGASRP